VFLAPPDGMHRVVRALEQRLGERIRRGHVVQRIERVTGGGWAVDGERADTVVIATPAFVTAGLLADVAPTASAAANAIDYAGVVLVTFAFDRASVARELDASGFLVPKVEGLLLTACSWTSSKWAHLGRDDQVVVRASAGHYGNEHALALDDDVLVQAMLGELSETMAVHGEPSEVRISRWPSAVPQYPPGHAARIDALDAALLEEAPGIVLTGAAYRGIGIPACIGSANAAAREAVRL
jgi:oxygen-dependent protoporphyrinogen oxidase